MSSKSISEYWKDRQVDNFDASAIASGRIKAIERLAEIAHYRLKSLDVSSVELGCGSGVFSAVSGIKNITGIDFSQTLLDAASKRMDHVLLADIFDLKMPRESIDNIVSLFVIDDYCDDKKTKFFADILIMLKPGGHLFFAAYSPNDEGMQRFQATLGYKAFVESERYYISLLTKTGFIIDSIEILKASGNFNMNATSEVIKREYILIKAIKK